MTYCFNCEKNVNGKDYEYCKNNKHDLDYENLYKYPSTEQKKNSRKNLEKDLADKRSDAKKLHDHALSKINKLVISENNSDEIFALVKNSKGVDTYQVTSRRFRDWLFNEFTKNINSDEIRSDDFFKMVANSIFSYARMNGTEIAKINTRISQMKDEIWYDLVRPDGAVIKISKNKVETAFLDLKSPIFRKNQSLQKQIMPKNEDENALDNLSNLLRINQKDKTVFKIHIITLFLEAYPIPMMVIGGPAGSFKTTTTAYVKRIVDPAGNAKEDNVSTIPSNIDDLVLAMGNRYLMSLDNVSNISKEESDVFCRAITGSTNSKRKLYTDEDESIRSFKRKIVLNGIVPHLDYPDLQSRLLIYERDSVEEKDRLTEEQLDQKFNELLPNVLGQIFPTLAKALSWYRSIKLDINPKTRMADFEVWGEIIARMLGYKDNEFLNAYYQKLNDAIISMEESYPLVTLLDDFMKEQPSYEGTATELYSSLINRADALQIDVRSKWIKFPKSPNGLGRAFKEIESMLKSNNLIVRKFVWTGSGKIHSKHSTMFKITKLNLQMRLQESSSPASSSSLNMQKQCEDGESSEGGEGNFHE